MIYLFEIEAPRLCPVAQNVTQIFNMGSASGSRQFQQCPNMSRFFPRKSSLSPTLKSWLHFHLARLSHVFNVFVCVHVCLFLPNQRKPGTFKYPLETLDLMYL